MVTISQALHVPPLRSVVLGSRQQWCMVSGMARKKRRARTRPAAEIGLILQILNKMTDDTRASYHLAVLAVSVILALGLVCRLDAQVIERVASIIMAGVRR